MSDEATDRSTTVLVSVVMPFKNAVDHIEEAARSVLAQGWRDVELVLVDDGGTDGSRSAAERVQASDPGRVRLVSHADRRNLGIGASRARGIRSAAGELTAFLDADDVWEPTHLEHQLALLRGAPGADVVCGRAWDWRSWADPAAPDTLSALAFAPGAVVPGGRLLTAVLRHGGFATPTCSLLAPTELLLACAAQLERFPGMYEDQVLNSLLQLRASVVMSGATTAWYRQHPASLTVQEQADVPAALRWDVGRRQFLEWLAAQPELAPGGGQPDVAALVQQARTALAQRTAAGGPPIPSLRTALLRQPVVARVLSTARLLQRGLSAIWYRSRRGEVALARAADRARPQRLARVLVRFGEDLRGRLLVVGAVSLADGLPDAVQVEARPYDGSAAGPYSPLADLPDRAFDCVVVTGTGDSDTALRSTLRHVRRVLAPCGAVLLELPPHSGGAVELARTGLGTDVVLVWIEHGAGPARAPMRVLRALSSQ